MELTQITAKAIFQLFLILGCGFFLAKKGVATQDTAKALTDILVLLTNPMALATSFLAQEYDTANTLGLLQGVLLSLYAIGVMILLSTIFVKKSGPNWEIERTITVYTNVGYVGLPLATAVLGTKGPFFLASFIAVNTFLIFTHGEAAMTGAFSRKRLLKCFLSPNIIAIGIGLVLYFAQIKLPELVITPMNQLAGCNTSLAMLIAGITIANQRMDAALRNPRLYLICGVKSLVMPLLLIPLSLVFSIPREVFLAALIGAACPAAAFIPIFALREGKDAGYAYGIFTVTTLGSIITTPLMAALYSAIG